MAEQLRQGPATFSLPDDAAVASAAVPQIGSPAAQGAPIQQGLQRGAPGVDDSDAKTFRAIADLASGMLAPKIKEAAQDQYIRGVQQAMTGQSLGEIVKEQPWYTDIFAPSSALVGARAYTAQRAVAEWAGKMQEQMPALAKQSPEVLQKAATSALQGFMTGDAAADSMMTSAVVEQMAPLFKQHAKEHYVFMQKQASEAQIGAWESLGKVYQGFAASGASGKGMVSKEDTEAAKDRLLGAIAPFADQSDESFERNISAFLEGAATAGNFQVVKLFKETGLYDKINPDRRATLDRTLHAWGNQALAKAMPQFALDIAMLTNDMTQDVRGIPEKVQALNAKAAAVTGVTEAELIPLGSLDNIMGRILVAQQHEGMAEARAARTAAEKQAQEVLELSTAVEQIKLGNGAIDRWTLIGEGKENVAEKAGLLLYSQAKTPEAKAAVLNARTVKGFEAVKSIYAAKLRSEEFQPGVASMSQEYAALEDNVKPLYFSEQDRAMLDRFNSMVRSDMPPAAAWVVARNSVGPSLIPEGAKDTVTKLIRSEVESQNETWYGSNTVTDASLRTIEGLVAKTYRADRANNSPEVAVKRAIAQAKARGLDVQGQHAMLKVRPTDPPLFAVIGESAGDTAKAFDSVMDQKAKALGATLDNYEVFRLPDAGKQARMRVSTYGKDGQVVTWDITSEELKTAATGIAAKQVRSTAAPMGPRSASGKVTDWVPQ